MTNQPGLRLVESRETAPAPHPRVALWIAILSEIGEVSIHRQPGGLYWVSVKPAQAAPLWWFDQAPDLDKALQGVAKKAVRMHFLTAEQVEQVQAAGQESDAAFEAWYLDVLRGHPNNLRKTTEGSYADPHVSQMVAAWRAAVGGGAHG